MTLLLEDTDIFRFGRGEKVYCALCEDVIRQKERAIPIKGYGFIHKNNCSCDKFLSDMGVDSEYFPAQPRSTKAKLRRMLQDMEANIDRLMPHFHIRESKKD